MKPRVRLLRAINNAIVPQLERLTTVVIAAMCLLVNWGIISRVVLQAPVAWFGEVTIYLNFWLVFIGASLATKRELDFRVDFFFSMLPKKWHRSIEFITNSICIGALIILIVSAIRLLLGIWNMRTSASDLPAPVVYSAILVGVCLLLFDYSCRLYLLCAYPIESERPKIYGSP